MNEKETFPIEQYLDIAIRRKWLIIIPFILSVFLTTGVYWKLPKIYRSDTLILVLPQKVPENYVKPTVTIPVDVRLRNITEEILSRTRMKTIINELNLYPELRKKMPLDQVIEKMRRDIAIRIKGRSSFRIYYQGKDPETVRRVTNRLASLFIEENIKTREQQARITTDFLRKELAAVKKKLEEQEKAITTFKFKHIGSLAEQTEANLAMLKQLSEQRQAIIESINAAQTQKSLIQQQLANTTQFITIDNPEDKPTEIDSPIQSQIMAAQKELARLRTIYTDEHIEVRKIKERIKQLKNQLKSSDKTKETKTEAQEEVQTEDPITSELRTQLVTLDAEIQRLKEEEARLKKQISIYQKRIEETPYVELKLAELTRGYKNTKAFYEELLKKKMHAEEAENLEKRQQGEQFKILDPPTLPTIPYKPNPYRVFPMGIFLGLGVGFGLAFLTEVMDKSFRTPKDVEEYLGIPVLATIPLIKGKATARGPQLTRIG